MASAYEQVRLANIERNKNFLRDIGFEGEGVVKPLLDAQSDGTGSKSVKGKKRQRSIPTVEHTPPEFRRRSARVSSLAVAPNYKEERIEREEWGSIGGKERLNGFEVDLSLHTKRSDYENDLSIVERDPPAQKDSSRALVANLEVFLGESMGTEIDAPVKAAIVEKAHKNAKFSKYSGILEWKNAVFLWVNIQADADYPNKFLDGGRRMTWFFPDPSQIIYMLSICLVFSCYNCPFFSSFHIPFHISQHLTCL